MGIVNKLTFRYNPQSIEKQVRKWPVFFSVKELKEDILLRLNQLLGLSEKNWCDPFSVAIPFDEETIYEYGVDACRLSLINSNSIKEAETLLESSYKWISKINDDYFKKINNTLFNPIPWLEALVQMEDHIKTRKASRLALSLVMKAFKISPPHSELKDRDKALVAACLFPFIPIFVTSKLLETTEIPTIKEIVDSYNEYYSVRVCLEKGGWHWYVFIRENFERDTLSELKKIKWIKKATFGKNIVVKEKGGGLIICFS